MNHRRLETDDHPRLSVILPALNEESSIAEALTQVHGRLMALGTDFELILVSDGSTDQTVFVATSLGLSELRVFEFDRNRGKGSALRLGHSEAHGDLIAFFDADGDISVGSLTALLKQLEVSGVDGVVGSKTHAESRVDYPRFRRFQSRVYRAVVRGLFRMPVGDTQTGVKVFRREVLDATLPFVSANGFEFDLEMLAIAHRLGYQIDEGPIELNFQHSSNVKMIDALHVMLGTIRIRTSLRSRHICPNDS